MTADYPFEYDLPELVEAIVRSTLDQYVRRTKLNLTGPLTIGTEHSNCDVLLSDRIVNYIQHPQGGWKSVFGDRPFICREDGSTDHLGTIVFMANYLQEYTLDQSDDIGRLPFDATYQAHFGNEREDACLKHFKAFLAEYRLGIWQDHASRLFVSHDNDGLFRSFKQDGMYALKKGRIDWLLSIVFSEIMRRPRWFNMDRIMDINDAYTLKSTFFWLVERGDVKLGNRRLRNGDYRIDDPKIVKQIKRIENRGFEQGLHKSISQLSFKEELARLPFPCDANRNHFLRLRIPEHFSELGAAGLSLDFSLGFAERLGLRNNAAIPLRPFDLVKKEKTRTLFVPLMIMDTTHWTYHNTSIDDFQNEVLGLIEQHRENAVISVLWHNKYFTEMKFKGYLGVYKSILELCHGLRINGITQEELIREYH